MTRLLILIAAIAAGSASAAPGPATATLAAPGRPTVLTDSGMWRCAGTACAGPGSTRLREAVGVCTSVADTAGRVVAFTAAGYAFSDADLVRCNRHVKS